MSQPNYQLSQSLLTCSSSTGKTPQSPVRALKRPRVTCGGVKQGEQSESESESEGWKRGRRRARQCSQQSHLVWTPTVYLDQSTICFSMTPGSCVVIAQAQADYSFQIDRVSVYVMHSWHCVKVQCWPQVQGNVFKLDLAQYVLQLWRKSCRKLQLIWRCDAQSHLISDRRAAGPFLFRQKVDAHVLTPLY